MEKDVTTVADWRDMLNADPTDWLLGEDNPSVCYFTLTELLGRAPDDPEVTAARRRHTLQQMGHAAGLVRAQASGRSARLTCQSGEWTEDG